MNRTSLFHDGRCFLRETLEERMGQYGLGNLARMELFLWDLEIFLQLQSIFADKLVLKGGAAVQFYLPIDHQRTSVDIDMIYCGSQSELAAALQEVEERMGATEDYFRFRHHLPRNPKTLHPLTTFFMTIPSVCADEFHGADFGTQELKIEFIHTSGPVEIAQRTGTNLFAVESGHSYNLLPLNALFADKLTTLGPETVGIGEARMDEQIKQLFDLDALLSYQFNVMDFEQIAAKYWERAEQEAMIRQIPFDRDCIIKDVRRQLNRLSGSDSGEDRDLVKQINDFQSLYIHGKAVKSPGEWAIIGEKIQCLVEAALFGKGRREEFSVVLETAELLQFPALSGIAKSEKIKKCKEALIAEFQSVARMPGKILRGKSLSRVFWAVVSLDNIDEVREMLLEIRRDR